MKIGTFFIAAALILTPAPLITKAQQATAGVSTHSAAPEEAPPQIPGDTRATASAPIEPRDQTIVLAHPRLGKAFWIPWIASAALTVTSVELTEHCIQSRQCVEGDPVFGKRPGRPELYGIRGGILGGAFLLARRSRLRGTSAWKYESMAIVPALATDTAWDAYVVASRPGRPHSALIAGTPPLAVEIVRPGARK